MAGFRSRAQKAKMPSSTGYLVVAIVAAVFLFLLLWWVLVASGDEAPWLPAGLITVVFLLVALSAREVLMRRAWTRYLLEHGIKPHSSGSQTRTGTQRRTFSLSQHSATVRAIQKQSAAADRPNTPPDAHLEVALLCQDFLSGTEEVLRSGTFSNEKTIALKSGKERIRALHKHHFLLWARDQARALTHDAQHKARTSDKIETANKALECIDSALAMYPDEVELHESKTAIGEFVASVRVAHWVELAQRSAFKGHYRRAVDRYKNALFYLNDAAVKTEIRATGAAQIETEISKLRDRLKSEQNQNEAPSTRMNSGGQA